MLRKITPGRPFKMLGFTDLHLDDFEACFAMTLKLMEETIRTEKPDLVVFAGDNVTGGDNRARAEMFQRTMTELKTPWAPILGNHEGDNPLSLSRREMIEIFRKSPFCMVPEMRARLSDGSGVFGETNYVLLLENEQGAVVHKLIFLDSGTDMTQEECKRRGIDAGPKSVDGCLQESQIAWYREQVHSDDCPSTVFLHIPLPEFREAAEKGTPLYGANHEKVSCSPWNSGLFDAVCEEGKTVAVVAGHDHINDSRTLYRGVVCMYNRMSGLSSYNLISKKLGSTLLQGCSVYFVDAAGAMTFGDILYEERYPQYHDDIYRVIRK